MFKLFPSKAWRKSSPGIIKQAEGRYANGRVRHAMSKQYATAVQAIEAAMFAGLYLCGEACIEDNGITTIMVGPKPDNNLKFY